MVEWEIELIVSRLWLTTSCADWEGIHVLFLFTAEKKCVCVCVYLCVFFKLCIRTFTVVLNLQLERTEKNIPVSHSRNDWCCNYFFLFIFTQLITSVSILILNKIPHRWLCVQKAPKGQSRVERLRKKMNEQESWLLLHSPTIPFCIHNKHGKVPSSPFFCLSASSCSV